MRVLLTTLNSSFTHTSLALQTLKESFAQKSESKETELLVKEFTINEDWTGVADRIFFLDAEMVMFSCYIWNIKEIALIAKRLKQWSPGLKIVLGGPEVGYTPYQALEKYPWADAVMCGEGEELFPLFVDYFAMKSQFVDHPSVVARKEDGKLYGLGQPSFLTELSNMAFPYSAKDLQEKKDRILYYESSRGCPYACQYCLSSLDQPLRFLPLPRVFSELKMFLDAHVKQVKFVDRTFNANRKRARAIWQFLIDNTNTKTNFHFELAGDLLEDEDIELLRKAPVGLFQFEIGIQSTNPDVLRVIQRVTNFSKIASSVAKLKELHNTHLHLDLIAGLPFEDLESLAESFDQVHSLGADLLQLGFLKVLPGTLMEAKAKEYGLVYDEAAPYEVLQTSHLSGEELLTIHHVEMVFQLYGNSGRYKNFLDGVLHQIKSPFAFYRELAEYYRAREWLYFPAKEFLHWQRLWDYTKQAFPPQEQVLLLNKLKVDFCFKYADQDFPLKEMEDEKSAEEVKAEKALLKDSSFLQELGLREGHKYKYRFAYLDYAPEHLLSHRKSIAELGEKFVYLFVYDFPKGTSLLAFGLVKENHFLRIKEG